ncbi:MAG: class I SAM-dependent methyltransferase [Parerythrobacter sp.]
MSTGHEDSAALRAHLDHVHAEQAGFTETCATACRDAEGRDSYTWLAQALNARDGGAMLDLACGSGVLLERLAAERFLTRLTGVDMSAPELALAATRLAGTGVELRQGTAQDLSFLGGGSARALCRHRRRAA